MVNCLLIGPIISRALNLLASLGLFEKRGNDWPVNRPKPAELIRLLKTAESSGTTMRHTDGRLCDTSTMNRKKPKTGHIGRHFIKAPQTMAWSDSQHRGWINSAGLGLDPLKRDRGGAVCREARRGKETASSFAASGRRLCAIYVTPSGRSPPDSCRRVPLRFRRIPNRPEQ